MFLSGYIYCIATVEMLCFGMVHVERLCFCMGIHVYGIAEVEKLCFGMVERLCFCMAERRCVVVVNMLYYGTCPPRIDYVDKFC